MSFSWFLAWFSHKCRLFSMMNILTNFLGNQRCPVRLGKTPSPTSSKVFFTVVDVTFRMRLRGNSRENVSSVQCIASFYTPITSSMSFFCIQRHHLEWIFVQVPGPGDSLKGATSPALSSNPSFPFPTLCHISPIVSAIPLTFKWTHQCLRAPRLA